MAYETSTSIPNRDEKASATAVAAQECRTTPGSHVKPEPWDQWKARAAHRNQVSREDAQMRCVYSVIDHMLEDLVLTDGERQRLRSVLLAQLWTDVSVASIVASAEALAS